MDREQAIGAARSFKCPRYEELPDMWLYLEQVLGYVNQVIAPIHSEALTGAMVNNYIKNKAVPSPVKKKYGREHMAYLIVTCLLKQVFTVQQIAGLYEIQRETYPLAKAYDFFCTEYENALREAFDFTGAALPCTESRRTEQTILIRTMVLAAANRVYVEKTYF
ncbi:MAG: DUF1836 domain-containing protein [Candidatus Heteroscillospira sp.]